LFHVKFLKLETKERGEINVGISKLPRKVNGAGF
jgi:hypothetical protein